MTTLSINKPRSLELGDYNDIPILAADIVYEGAMVGDNGSGFGRPLVAGDPFRGVAVNKTDNAAGAAGDKTIRVLRRGSIVLPISALAIDDVGKDVYASDDDTFTLTQGSNTRIGYVARFVETGVGVIYFEENSGVLVELTIAAGSANDALVDVTGSFNQTILNDNFADIATKLNFLLRKMGG